MDVLKNLFEQHFHSPVGRVQPLKDQLSGSGRKIMRLANEKASAIGILYDVREENVAFLEFSKHFRRHGLPVPEIYAEDLSHGAYLEEDLGDTTLFEFLSTNRAGENIAPQAVEAYRKVVGRVAALSDRSRPQSELQSLLSARQLRSPVHRLGFELFQVLLPQARGHSFQRASAGRRFQPLDEVPAESRARLLSLSGFPITQCHVARWQSIFLGLSRRSQRRAAI